MKPPGFRPVNGKRDKVAHIHRPAKIGLQRAAVGERVCFTVAMNLRPLLRLLAACAALAAFTGCANFPANTPTAAAPQPAAQTTAP